MIDKMNVQDFCKVFIGFSDTGLPFIIEHTYFCLFDAIT